MNISYIKKEKPLFKMPFTWIPLWKTLTDEELGILVRLLFYLAEHKTVDIPEEIRPDAIIVFEKCFDDVVYQFDHPRACRRPENVREIRNSEEYRQWRAAVFERDHYTCQNCGKTGGGLNAHHIKPFSKHPELRFDVDNGITLCTECHKLAHPRGFRNA